MPLLSDQYIASRCHTEARWFGLLYKRYVKKIYGFIRVRVNTIEDAEDITSTVFTKALRGINSYDPAQPFQAWLYSIARHSLIDFWRAQRTTIDLATIECHEALQQAPVDLDPKLLTEKLLRSLSGEECYLVSLRFQDGLSYEQIAELTGKEANTLMVQFHRLKKKLHNVYEQ